MFKAVREVVRSHPSAPVALVVTPIISPLIHCESCRDRHPAAGTAMPFFLVAKGQGSSPLWLGVNGPPVPQTGNTEDLSNGKTPDFGSGNVGSTPASSASPEHGQKAPESVQIRNHATYLEERYMLPYSSGKRTSVKLRLSENTSLAPRLGGAGSNPAGTSITRITMVLVLLR